MKRYFMIINSETGENKGFYLTEIWKYENILKEVQVGQVLKEISEELWTILLGNNELIKLKSPVIKLNKIEEFINTDFLSEINLNMVFFNLFEEQEFEQIPYEPSQVEKDIKILAETLKEIIEPMLLPAEGEGNKSLVRLQQIIERYS